LAAFVTLGLFSSCAQHQDRVRIGVLLPLSGPLSSFGQECLTGLQIARDEINAAGGLPSGKKIELVLADTRGDPGETDDAVRTLINVERVPLIIGEVLSSNSLVAASICQSEGVPLLSPGSTNPKVTEAGDYVATVCFSDPFQGLAMATFARNTLKARTAVVVSDANSDYSRDLASHFSRRFRDLNGQVLREIWYVQGATDFAPEIQDIQHYRPDCVFVPGYYIEAATFLKQARAAGVKIPFLGGDGWESPRIFEMAGEALAPSYITSHFSPQDRDSLVQRFVKTYEGTHKSKPTALAALGYDALRVASQAIARAHAPNREAIREAILSTAGFHGVTGTITIGPDRSASKDVFILRGEKGSFAFVSRMSP
jgi:branched-chain amino acid transport system substrate-binding protein